MQSQLVNVFVNPQPANWGEASICDAERRLLANALLEPANERFILVSESCIPLYNFTYIYTAFTSIPYSYVQAFDDPSVYGRGRCGTSCSLDTRT